MHSPAMSTMHASSSAQNVCQLSPFRDLTWESVARGWESQREEYAYWVPAADIEGSIPDELVGTIFRNGPGLNDVYGTRLKHHIDGDGLIAAITFLPVVDPSAKKKVHFRSRFVRSKHHVEEREARKFLYRGQMGTQASSWIRDTYNTARDIITRTVTPLQYRNPSNTNVSYHGGKLLSCYETGLPHTLDPRTLMTLGLENLGGALTTGTMSAHFRVDAARDRLVVISLRPGLRKGSVLSICEFDRSWRLIQKQTHRIKYLNYAHDFILTPSFYVFHITPFVRISTESVYQVASGVSSPGEQMKYYDDLPSRMVVIPRDIARQSELRMFDVPPVHIFHFGTSQENYVIGAKPAADTVQSIEFSAVCLPKEFAMYPAEHDAFLSNIDSAPARLGYFVLPFGKESTPVPLIQLDASSCEFPSTHPNRHGLPSRYTWIMANARGANLPFRDICKIDQHAALNEARTEAKQEKKIDKSKTAAPSPPSAVTSTRKDEDDGWLFVQCYIPENHTTDLVILCARDPQKGPLAIIHLKHHVCYGFHGTFTPYVFFHDSVDGTSIREDAPPELKAKL